MQINADQISAADANASAILADDELNNLIGLEVLRLQEGWQRLINNNVGRRIAEIRIGGEFFGVIWQRSKVNTIDQLSSVDEFDVTIVGEREEFSVTSKLANQLVIEAASRASER